MDQGTPRDALESVLDAVAHRGGWGREWRHSRRKPYPDARNEVFAWLRQFGWSLPHIGRVMGRDHSTVLYGIQMAKQRGTTWVTEVLNEQRTTNPNLDLALSRLGTSSWPQTREVSTEGNAASDLSEPVGLACAEEH